MAIQFFRLFHHLFAVGVVLISIITLALGRGSAWFPLHRNLGLILAGMVVVWIAKAFLVRAGLRFGPLRFSDSRAPAPSPMAAVVTLTMLGLIVALAVTGVLMTRGFLGLAPLHGIMSWALVLTIIAHLLGTVAHSMRRQQATTKASPILPS
jgi:hypothetical protein